jgi:hypothetical protein
MTSKNIPITADSIVIEKFLGALFEHARAMIKDLPEAEHETAAIGFMLMKNERVTSGQAISLGADKGNIGKHAQLLTAWSDQGGTVYFRNCIGPLRKSAHLWAERDVIKPLGITFDRDGDHRQKGGKAFPLVPTIQIQTSRGAFHDHFWPSEPWDTADFAHLTEGLSGLVGVDHGTSTASHLYRVPGTVNYPTAAKIQAGRCPELVLWERAGMPLQKHPLANLLSVINRLRQGQETPQRGGRGLLAAKNSVPAQTLARAPAELPPHIIAVLEETWVEGERSDRNMALISDLCRLGYSGEQVLDLAREYPWSLGAKMADRSEAWMVNEISRVFKKAATHPRGDFLEDGSRRRLI